MRLARLDLTRYGHFSGVALAFGPARPRDVTIVYGDNEAGKSTAFAAWLDLLFGIPKRLPPYAFLHPRGEMEIGARIEAPDPLELVRTGRGLSDAAGHGLDELRLTSLLHGLDRDAYRMRFSLDDDTLRRGGEEIASAQGDLGQALHAGTSGMAGAGAALDALRLEADGFHRKRASKTILAAAKTQLAELERAIRDDGLDPRHWDDLDHAVDEAEKAVAMADLAAVRAAKAVTLCQTVADLVEIDAEIRALQTELDGLPDGPDLPPDAAAEIGAALGKLDQVAKDEAVAMADRTVAQASLAEIPADEAGLVLADEVARIDAIRLPDGTSLVGRMEGELADLPKREVALADRRAARDAALGEAGLGALPAFDGPALDRIDGLLARAEQADRDLVRAAATVRRDEDALPPEPPLPEGRDTLIHALDDLPDPARLSDLARRATEARAAVDQAAATLPVDWRDRALGLPEDEDAEAALAALALAEANATAAEAEVAKALAAQETARAERDRAAAHPGAVGDTARAEARHQRDGLWDRHRAALDADTADVFAEAMRRHDDLADRHALGAAARAELAAAEAQSQRADRAAQQAADGAATARAAVAAPSALVRKLLDRLGVQDRAALRPRLRRLREAAKADVSARQADADHAAASAVEAERLAVLGHALAVTGAAPDGDLRRQGRAQADLLAKAAASRAAYLDALARLNDSRADRDVCQVSVDEARAALHAALAGTILADWTAAALRAAIVPLRRALGLEAECRGLVERIDTIKEAHARLVTETANLPPLENDGDDLARLAAARRRATSAQDAARRHDIAQRALTEAEARLTRLTSRRTRAEAEIDRVLVGQAGDGAVPDRLRILLHRDGLRHALAMAAQREQTLRTGIEAEAMAAEAAKTAPGRLADLQAAAETRIAERDTAREAVGAAREKRRVAAQAAGAQAARQARAALLESLRPQARAAAALRLGEAAARRALLRHQEERRGRMLETAEAAFARLTNGAWTRLETGQGEKGEALFAIGHGARTRVDALSTGTRGQVYLALRLAGHALFAETAGPLPFVLDDIAETFDDSRARATLAMLGELGDQGQAILMTHHRHLVDMARDTVPAVRVIELPARTTMQAD